MKNPVLGMDPSLRHWGLAETELDLDSGVITTPIITIIEPIEEKSKQVRQNSKDLQATEGLAKIIFPAARKAKAIFVEVPGGSQSARAMASYGVCVGILGALRAEGIQIIEVTANECKLALSGIKNATKQQMIDAAVSAYPDANWPTHRGSITNKAEHGADALSAIYAGVNTPMFQNLMRILKG